MSRLFKVKDGGLFSVEQVGPEQAASVGCPDATHVLIQTHQQVYGTITPSGRIKGREVRVPGVAGRTFGVRSIFRDAQPKGYATEEERTVLDGYLLPY